MTDSDYIEIARQDRVWREIRASFAIEGMVMTEANEIIAGRMATGEIDLATAIRIIVQDAGLSSKQ